MTQHYSDPARADDPHALPDLEVFKGYDAECRDCEHYQPVFPDYYGLIHQDAEECVECGHKGLRVTDTKVKWFYWYCFPGCMPDSDPVGPFATEAEALADARQGVE